MGCGGCAKRAVEMRAKLEAQKKASKIPLPAPVIPAPVVKGPVTPQVKPLPLAHYSPPIVPRSRRQLRVEARVIRIANRNARMVARQNAIAEAKKIGSH